MLKIDANDGGVIPPPIVAPISAEQSGFVRQCVEVILTLCRVFGFDSNGYSPKGTMDHWVHCASVWGDPLKFVKWKISAYYSFHKNQTIPSCPLGMDDHPGVLLGGRGYKFLNIMKRTDKCLFESFITSVLYSKKGMPRPSKAYIRKSEEAAFEKLTKAVPFQNSKCLLQSDKVKKVCKLVEFELSEKTVRYQIERTVLELFEDVTYTAMERIEPFFPSTSANYINSRAMMGAVGAIVEDPDLIGDLLIKDEESLVDLKIIRTRHSEMVGCESAKLRMYFSRLYDNIVKKVAKEEAIAIPLGLPEALKVRVISKGPPLLYTMLKPLQKKLWKTLKFHPCFKFIGTPDNSVHIQDRMGANLKETHKFLSVDYTDATNEMMSFCSNQAVKSICEILDLPKYESDAFLKALTGHTIEYEGVQRPQTMGQLMGSIVSFPILCIVNAAICRWALEISDNHKWLLRDCPLTINGDDAVMKINSYGVSVWEQIGAFCGLSPSIGKVYYSDNFLNINSHSYTFHPLGYVGISNTIKGRRVNRVINFEKIDHVNLGILFNQKRSGGSGSVVDSGEKSLGSRACELVEGSPYCLRERVLCQFLHINGDKLKVARFPWFIPEYLGGLGLPCIGKYQPSNHDLRLARMIYDHDEFRLPSKPKNNSWIVWSYAKEKMKVLPKHGFVAAAAFQSSMTEDVITEAQLASLYCVEALFHGKTDLLYKAIDEDKHCMKKWIRQIQSVWKRAMLSKIPYPEPFNPTHYPVVYSVSDIPYIHEMKSTNLTTPCM